MNREEWSTASEKLIRCGIVVGSAWVSRSRRRGSQMDNNRINNLCQIAIITSRVRGPSRVSSVGDDVQ